MTLIAFIGISTIFYIVYKLIIFVYYNFFSKISLDKYQNGHSWAVITGSTDGIGLEFARELAQYGFNILLIGRNKDKLESVKQNIQSSKSLQKIQVDWVISDASDDSEANIQNVVRKVESLDVSILINNVGTSIEEHKSLDKATFSEISKTIKVNCLYPTLLTSAIIPIMKRHSGSKLIINISSILGYFTSPLMTTYAATKSFNRIFSLSLSSELYTLGFDVLCCSPGLVATNMTKLKEGLLAESTRSCVQFTLKKIGLVEIIPCISHSITFWMSYLLECLPFWIKPLITFHVIKQGMQFLNNQRKTASAKGLKKE